MSVLSIFSGKPSVPVYQDIDEMPIFNWFKISETNDLSWLLLDRKDFKKADPKLLEKTFEELRDQWLDTFGIPEKMREVWVLKRDIFVLECDLHLTGDRSLITFIEIKKSELQEALKAEQADIQLTNTEVKAYVEKFMHIKIDAKTTSMRDYYTYVKLLKDEAAKQQLTNQDYGRE